MTGRLKRREFRWGMRPRSTYATKTAKKGWPDSGPGTRMTLVFATCWFQRTQVLASLRAFFQDTKKLYAEVPGVAWRIHDQTVEEILALEDMLPELEPGS